MAKFCSNCGHQLSDTAKFCEKCGTPLGGAPVQDQPQQWEYCEITWAKKGFMGGKSFFWARNLQTGAMVARNTNTFPALQDPASAPFDFAPFVPLYDYAGSSFEALQQWLLNAGWEPISPSGTSWWSYRFRHPVKP